MSPGGVMSGFIGRAKVGSALCASLCFWSVTAHAQPDARDVAIQNQLLMFQRLFDSIDQAPPSRQMFNLYFAEVLLSTAPNGLEALGLEDAIGGGALERIRALESSRDPEVARQARVVRGRMETLVSGGAGPAIPTLEIETNGDRRIDVRRDGAAQWVALPVRQGLEYRVDAGDCPMLRVLAVDQNGGKPIAGGTVFGRSFTFVIAEDRTARLRLQTPLCTGENDLTIGAAPEAMRVTLATETSPQAVKEGLRFRGTLDGSDSAQWFRLDAAAVSRRFVVTAQPLASELDTKITVYDPRTQEEIGSDDDGGDGLGSRLEIRSSAAMNGLVVKVEQIGDEHGDYDLTIRSTAPIGAGARPLIVRDAARGKLDGESHDTWGVEFAAGRRYDISTEPLSSGLDTKVTLYDADENELGSNDDGGTNLGSRLQYTSTMAGTFFIKVEAIEETSGEYGIVVSEGAPVSEIAKAGVFGENQGRLQIESEEWWVFDVVAGAVLQFEAIPGNSQLDTILELYESDAVTLLAEDDDGGEGYGSKLTHKVEQAGRLYLRVRRFDSSTGDYTLVLRTAP